MRVWALFCAFLPFSLAQSNETCANFRDACPTQGPVYYLENPSTTPCVGSCTILDCCTPLNLGLECEGEATNCSNHGMCKNITGGMYLEVRGPCGTSNAKPLSSIGNVDDGLMMCMQSSTCVGIEADLNTDVFYMLTEIQGISKAGSGASCYRKYMEDVDYCVCDFGWGGPDCSIKKKTCEQNCLARGQCDSETGQCLCNSPYTGSYCQNAPPCPPLKNGSLPCNGHGACEQTGVCRCDVTHIGADCGIEVAQQGMTQGAFAAAVIVPLFGSLAICAGLGVWIAKAED